ncbi:MAG: cyclic pyranopterin monophosphate synthase MoaC [Rhodospirillales bacterium]|nr:cyclic pyranopterin monophosphate synthase MoaC [Rhodospirillales bacterium]
MNERFTHLDESGRARMVDVGEKAVTRRTATAAARVTMSPSTLQMILDGGHQKGDVLGVARVAGIMAAKRTHELIPLCHPLPLDSVAVELSCQPAEEAVEIRATCATSARTGVEMEALTAASVAALTVYDMCKSVDRAMRIDAVRLLHKAGGKSGTFRAS